MIYPEFVQKFGSAIPDYRGYFLRGHGRNSKNLGEVQDDAIRTTEISAKWQSCVAPWAKPRPYFQGAVSGEKLSNWMDGSDNQDGLYEFSLNIANAWPEKYRGPEFRPVNKAVKYIIRIR